MEHYAPQAGEGEVGGLEANGRCCAQLHKGVFGTWAGLSTVELEKQSIKHETLSFLLCLSSGPVKISVVIPGFDTVGIM